MIRVIVVDDSALIRTLLSEIINAQDGMKVVGVAADPYDAREKIKVLDPDVITLDVEMPRMNGLDFLEKLMRLRPLPVVMVSSLTEAGAVTTLRALELGAVDFVAKPHDAADGLTVLAEEIGEKIRAAAHARIRRYVPTPATAVKKGAPPTALVHDSIVAIGASTGGTEAIKDVMMRMPRNSPPIVITQHMPPGFTASYAARLNGLCEIDVKEAEAGERLLSGRAYVAPGHSHLLVVKKGGTAYTKLDAGERVNRHRPSVDVLFHSVVQAFGSKVSAAILTGMGRDGAAGTAEVKAAGGHTIAQDEESCIVFGMPKAAIEVGGVDEILPLDRIADALSRGFALSTIAR